MIDHVEIRRQSYYDSVTLMLASKELLESADVRVASIGSGTRLNLELVAEQGFALPDEVGPNDLIVALRLSEGASVAGALAALDELLKPPRLEAGGARKLMAPVSVRAAARRRPEANLAVLSVPRHSLAFEIASALDVGLNVFCFSDGLSIDAERCFKEQAIERGLLLMGPDCGTAILDGVGLGFANVVRPGPVGIVGASGTGIQEVSCLLHRAEIGVSQVYGVGGRDMTAAVGGAMTLECVRRLGSDATTDTVLVVSKPPAPHVAEKVAQAVRDCGRPAALCFLGSRQKELVGVPVLSTLEAAARWAVAQHNGSWPDEDPELSGQELVSGEVRGLFSGGTLAYEAMATLSEALGPIASNIPLRPEWRVADVRHPQGNVVIDFGEDELTEGRAHPMIDPRMRHAYLDAATADPGVGVVLMDLVLGHGSHADPGAELSQRIRTALADRPHGLGVVVSVCGTELDPQDASRQAASLTNAGALITWSAASAARTALRLLGRGTP